MKALRNLAPLEFAIDKPRMTKATSATLSAGLLNAPIGVQFGQYPPSAMRQKPWHWLELNGG